MAAGAGCGAPPEGDGPQADSLFVEALADVHLADARAALDTTGRDPDALAESLRAVALAPHRLDASALAERLDMLADDPERLRVTYDALESRLALERQGVGTE